MRLATLVLVVMGRQCSAAHGTATPSRGGCVPKEGWLHLEDACYTTCIRRSVVLQCPERITYACENAQTLLMYYVSGNSNL